VGGRADAEGSGVSRTKEGGVGRCGEIIWVEGLRDGVWDGRATRYKRGAHQRDGISSRYLESPRASKEGGASSTSGCPRVRWTHLLLLPVHEDLFSQQPPPRPLQKTTPTRPLLPSPDTRRKVFGPRIVHSTRLQTLEVHLALAPPPPLARERQEALGRDTQRETTQGTWIGRAATPVPVEIREREETELSRGG
jgi:hypothetical protein